MFKVFWKTDTGFTGMSEKPMPFKEAIIWVDAMNKKYPTCTHWVQEV